MLVTYNAIVNVFAVDGPDPPSARQFPSHSEGRKKEA